VSPCWLEDRHVGLNSGYKFCSHRGEFFKGSHLLLSGCPFRSFTSHFQPNRSDIFQADVRHVSRGFDDDKISARGMVYRAGFSLPNPFLTLVMIALPYCIVWA